ncbi:Transcription initiation factor IIE subunit alpha [Aphelenchoides bicaudatus]|nr:Transcription initiation factor IIE subunit alpha [Aphelenchoides bicaudatus]
MRKEGGKPRRRNEFLEDDKYNSRQFGAWRKKSPQLHQTKNYNEGDDNSMPRRPRTASKSKSFYIPEDEPFKSSYDDLHFDIKNRCGYAKSNASSSVLSAVQRREICSNWVNKHFLCTNHRSRPGGFTAAEQVNLESNFFPNRRRRIDAVRAKTFCVGYINGGNHKIRLYEKFGARRQYFLQRALDVPYVGWSILDVVVSPDGKDIVYSTWNEAMYQCTIDGDESDENWIPLRVEATEARFALFSIRFNNTGTEIVAGSTDQHLYIYNRECCSSVLTLKAHDDDVNAVCFGDAESNILLSGADDGLVKQDLLGFLLDIETALLFIDSRGDDRYFLSNSKDQTIKVWDIRHFATEEGIESTRDSVRKQQWDYRWQTPEPNIKTLRMDGDCSILTLRGHSVLHTLVRARFSPEHTGKRFIYSGCGRGNIVVYDIYTGKISKVFKGHLSVVRDVGWSPTENEIIGASWDGAVSHWRYDERYARNINPNGGEMGDEDSTDENYKPIQTKSGSRRRRAARDDENDDEIRKTRR